MSTTDHDLPHIHDFCNIFFLLFLLYSFYILFFFIFLDLRFIFLSHVHHGLPNSRVNTNTLTDDDQDEDEDDDDELMIM